MGWREKRMKEGLKVSCWLTSLCGVKCGPFFVCGFFFFFFFLGVLEFLLIRFIPEKFYLEFFLAET